MGKDDRQEIMSKDYFDKYYESSEFKAMFLNFEESRKKGEDCLLSSNELTDIAEFYYTKGDMRHAKETAEYAVSIYDDATAPLLFLAKIEIQLNKNAEKGKEFLDRVQEKDNIDYLLCRLELELMEKGHEENALKIVCDGFNTVEDEEKAPFIGESVHLVLDYKKSELAHEIMKAHADALDPSNRSLIEARFALWEGKPELGLSILEKLIDKDTFNVQYWLILSTAQLQCGKFDEAISSAEYAIAIEPDAYEAYMNMGNAYIRICNYEKAIEAFKRYSQIRDDEVGYMMIGRCLFYMHKDEEAIKMLHLAEKKCTVNKANLLDINKDLTMVYAATKDYEASIAYLEKVKEETRGKYDRERVSIQISILMGLGCNKEAMEMLNLVLNDLEERNEKEEQIQLMFQTAIVFYESKDDAEAYTLFKKVYSLDPECTVAMPYFAFCCYTQQKWDDYLHALKTSVELYPEETKAVLAELFPEGMEPYDFVKYAEEHHIK